MLSRILRGRLLWTILGITAVGYMMRQRNERGRGPVVERFMEQNGTGRSPTWELALRAGKAAVDSARRLVLR